MNERPILFSAPMIRAILSGAKTQTRRTVHPMHMSITGELLRYPYGEPGDRLWARETWAHDADSLEMLRALVDDIMPTRDYGPYYRATGAYEGSGLRWRPSIHMPRWASRITLEVTDVRVERLQSISEEDALAEGVDPLEWSGGPANADARAAFRELWESINGKRAPWATNPWVWAISFRRLAK